jgi:hypothetical protein
MSLAHAVLSSGSHNPHSHTFSSSVSYTYDAGKYSGREVCAGWQ